MNLNIYHYNSIISFIELNPEYEYKFFTDNECRQYIKNNLSKIDEDYNILKAYDLLITGALKCDIFKYFYLYINGGCYFHSKMILKKSLRKIIDPMDNIILCGDEKSYYGGIIMVTKNNEYIYSLLKDSCINILKMNKGNEPYSVTRKLIFYENFNNIESKLIRHNDNIYLKNMEKNEENVILRMHYKNYYNNYYNTSRDFRYMWNLNLIFYKYNITITEYTFYYYLEADNDKFEIYNVENNIFSIKRIDTTTGWGQNIKLKVIHQENIYNIYVGNSNENEKNFIVE